MRIHPLFKWFGSKWGAAKHYPEPEFDRLYETHAGSAGYALNHVDKKVTIIEVNSQLLCLWDWLINVASERLIREIPINIPEGTDIRELGLTSGQELLLKHWQRTNNVGDCWTISPWGNKSGQWTANTRARVAEEVQAVGHWVIRGTYPWHREVESTIFVDPMYQYNYQYKSSPIDYKELAAKVLQASRKNQLIVCEATCPKTGRAPKWLPFKPSHRQVTSRRKAGNNVHSKELIFTRGPLKEGWILR